VPSGSHRSRSWRSVGSLDRPSDRTVRVLRGIAAVPKPTVAGCKRPFAPLGRSDGCNTFLSETEVCGSAEMIPNRLCRIRPADPVARGISSRRCDGVAGFPLLPIGGIATPEHPVPLGRRWRTVPIPRLQAADDRLIATRTLIAGTRSLAPGTAPRLLDSPLGAPPLVLLLAFLLALPLLLLPVFPSGLFAQHSTRW
jgi:hypothetical protein